MDYTGDFHTQTEGGEFVSFRRLADGRVEVEIDINGLGKTSWYFSGADWSKAHRALKAPKR